MIAKEVCNTSSIWFEQEMLKHIDRMACSSDANLAEVIKDYGEAGKCSNWDSTWAENYEYDEERHNWVVPGTNSNIAFF